MKLIVGLGNPGKQYEKTHHNSGFIILDELKSIFNFPDFIFEKKFNAEATEGKINEEKIILAKPQTFMNLSGTSVRSILDFYKISSEDLIVIHDDVDIEFGKIRTSEDSGAAGHNGVQNIIDNIGTQKFKRFRIGTLGEEKRKELKMPVDDFVLQKFSDEEMETIKNLAQEINF
jgi:peptidyl-tRNA hydrolase, PTH1 family